MKKSIGQVNKIANFWDTTHPQENCNTNRGIYSRIANPLKPNFLNGAYA